MGGQAGNRGYMLQGVIAVLDSFVRNDWISVAIEPNEDTQKVDIKWRDEYNSETVCQVKSSSGNFDKSQILAMLKELTDDVPEASSYKLVLIGTYSSDTKKFFNNFKDRSANEFGDRYKSLDQFKEKITIDLKALDIDALDGAVGNKVHEFLSARHYVAAHPTIHLIALGLHAQFARFANDGRKVSRSELEEQILHWVKFNYPNDVKSDKGNLSLSFYIKNKINDTGIFEDYYRIGDINDLQLISEKKGEILELYRKINEIKLPLKDDEKVSKNTNPTVRFPGLPQLDLSYAGYDREEKDKIARLTESLLGLQLSEGYFNVGNLKKSSSSYSVLGLMQGPSYVGSEEEIKKGNLLREFVYEIEVLHDLLECWRNLQDYRVIPIVISNNSDVLYENVELQLKIPEDVEILTSENFPYPSYLRNIELLSEQEGLLELYFQHVKDSRVKEYDYRNIRPIDIGINDPIFGKSMPQYKNYLESVLEVIFDYEIFSDIPGYQTFQCIFRALKPQDKMALPSHLFVKCNGAFTIEYSIKSNQWSGFTGVLQII